MKLTYKTWANGIPYSIAEVLASFSTKENSYTYHILLCESLNFGKRYVFGTEEKGDLYILDLLEEKELQGVLNAAEGDSLIPEFFKTPILVTRIATKANFNVIYPDLDWEMDWEKLK